MSSFGMTRLKLADLQEHLQPRLDVVREELGRSIAAGFPLIAEGNSPAEVLTFVKTLSDGAHRA